MVDQLTHVKDSQISFFLLNATYFDVIHIPAGVKPERFNQPNHGQARTQPLGTLPFEVIATTDQYQPGQQIQGKKIKYCP